MYKRNTSATIRMLAAILVMGMFDYVWYRFGLFWLFWCVCAVLMNVTQERRER